MSVSLLLATANPNKVEEYRSLLDSLGANIRSLEDVGLLDLPEETGETFEENALLKARYCAQQSGLLLLADDSGLEVEALGGEPGVRSNRWAGPDKTDADRVHLLLERVRDVPEEARTARFVCVVAVVTPEGEERTVRGTLEGMLATAPRGISGFGYDPILYLPELRRTVGELSAQEKNALSHRGRAVQAALPWLQEYTQRAAGEQGT